MKVKEMLKMMVLCTIIAIIFTLSMPGLSFATGNTIKWRMAVLYPRGVSFGVTYQTFADNVKRMSNGRLEINVVYDGEGVPATEVLSATRSGLVEMGSPYMALHAGEFSAGVVELGLPGGPNSYQEIMAMFHEGGWLESLRKGYDSIGLYYLTESYQPATYVLTKKPINSIDDFKKLKIRAPGAYGKMLKNIGASPVTMAFSEVYTALATGVIDGVDGCNLVDHESGKFYEVAKYMYLLPLTGSQVAPLIVNKNAWNKLPDDLKAILESAGSIFGMDQMAKSIVWSKESLTKMKAKGLMVSPQPSPEDIAKWNAAGKATWGEYRSKDKYCAELLDLQEKFLNRINN